MKNENPQKAIFIDRDGTLIEEVNFLSNVADMRFFSFTETAVRRLKDAGFLVIVVTNQSGIGRGMFAESDMHSIHEAIDLRLGSPIDAYYYCPHLPDAGCACRKPGIGMIEAARADFAIEINGSWMIGDKRSDIETEFAAGLRTALVRTGYGSATEHIEGRRPDIIVASLDAAVDEILRTS